jgi:hypothetical protein
MKIEDQIQLHSDRAMIELDRALDADCIQAARAHFELSTLHLDRVRTLKQKQAQVPQL